MTDRYLPIGTPTAYIATPARTELTPGPVLRMHWVPSRPARARIKPAGFIVPCQPCLADKPPSGADWQHEIKWDGYRVIARKDAQRVRLWARTGTDYTTCLDRIRVAIAALPVASAVLDGEAVAFDDEGRADFHALRSREGHANAVLVAYDVPETDGQDYGATPYRVNRSVTRGEADAYIEQSGDRERLSTGSCP